MWIFGCKKSHPIELIEVPLGESILSLKNQEPNKAVLSLKGKTSERLEWDLQLNDKDGGSAWGGEALYPLDDGRLVYCGMAFDPEMVQSCWVVDGKKATRIVEPVLKPNPTLQDMAARSVGFASNGAWWAIEEDRLEFSESRDKAAEPLELPVSGPYRRVAYSPKTDWFAVATEEDKTCKISIVNRTTLELVDTLPIENCHTNLRWNGDGRSLGFVLSNSLSLWEPKGQKKQLTARAKGPDGRDEEMRLLAFSPDSTRVLIRSSRYQKMAHNPMAGVYNARFETFVIDIASGEWKRLPDTGNVAVWVGSGG